MSTKGGPVFTFSLPGEQLAPCPPVNYATARKYTYMRVTRFKIKDLMGLQLR